MKHCPFCKEQINDEAIKCRFCQSMLLPLQVPEQKSTANGPVTYVVDRDLIRFAKFAGAVLALFLVVGMYLFGFKLEAALEKARAMQDQLALAQRDLQSAQATVKNLKQDIDAKLQEATVILADIQEQKQIAIQATISIKSLNPEQAAVLQQVKSEPRNSDKVRAGSLGRYWMPGITLKIRFLDGDDASKQSVKEAAKEWTEYANIKFEFVSSGNSEIRVSFKDQGSWSFLGTDALVVPQDQPTMNFEWVTRRNLLHEFGHALGLIEELNNPKAHIRWNKAVVYRELGGSPNNWSREQIDVIFTSVPQEKLGPYRDFDPESIMAMSVPATWTDGIAIVGGEKLSNSDKALIARLYPRK